MPRFFKADFTNEIMGDDAKHIIKALRMQVGESLTVCDGNGFDYHCQIESILDNRVILNVQEKVPSSSEPTLKVTLYQCFLKNDKFSDVIKHSVELGVTTIVPVLSTFCVSRPKKEEYKKKTEKYQKIAESAAKQSGRGIIPKVLEPIDIKDVPKNAILFYECGGEKIGDVILKATQNNELSILIGSEGGISKDEAEMFNNKATLGSRILRAETAPLTALSLIMYLTNNME